MKIIGFGNALVDVLVPIDDESVLQELRLPKGGMTLIDDQTYSLLHATLSDLPTTRATGGSAANTILALSALYPDTVFVGTVGKDDYGDFFRDLQLRQGIDSRLAYSDACSTGIATTFISPDRERTFATFLGAAALVDADTIPYNSGDLLHIEGYMVQNHDVIEDVLSRAKQTGMTVSYDLASWNIVEQDRDFIRHLVTHYVDIVFANQEEAAAYCQTEDMEVAVAELAKDCPIAVVKLGKHGAVAHCKNDDKAVFVPVTTVGNVVDTTAAGDFFAAGFLYGYATHQPMDKCLGFGHRLAGEVIQVMGTQVTSEQLRKAIGMTNDE
ncbi:MAG: adenosine kinase [Bacteroidaceae bacterium]|nr:adenosine kinase [Bacteroidaceae bacterium]